MGELIVFEGSDRSGKSTQAKMLADTLSGLGNSVVQFSFPTRNNFFGAELRKWLAGEVEYDSRSVDLLFEADRYQELQTLRNALDAFDYVIVDRFWRTGVIYSLRRGGDIDWTLSVSKPYISEFAPKENIINLRRELDKTLLVGDSIGDRYDQDFLVEDLFVEYMDKLDESYPAKNYLKFNVQYQDIDGTIKTTQQYDLHLEILEQLERVLNVSFTQEHKERERGDDRRQDY